MPRNADPGIPARAVLFTRNYCHAPRLQRFSAPQDFCCTQRAASDTIPCGCSRMPFRGLKSCQNARPQCINPSRAPGPAESELAMLHSYPFASRTLERRLPRATTITTSSSPAWTARPTRTMAAAAPTRCLAPWTGPTPLRASLDPSEMISMPGRPHSRPGNPVEVLL
jgi:hypothetical protein